MGACLSCLGVRRRDSYPEDGEADQLLGEPYSTQYGGVGGPAMTSTAEPDPEDIKRQRDALERICNHATDNLVDILHPSAPIDWARLFAHAFPPAAPLPGSRPLSSSSTAVVEPMSEQEWLDGIHAIYGDCWNKVYYPEQIGSVTMELKRAVTAGDENNGGA